MGRKPEVIIETKKTDIEGILRKAENNRLYNTQTEGNNFGYVYDDGWIAVIMPTGSMRMRLEKALTFGEELTEICRELTDLIERRILE